MDAPLSGLHWLAVPLVSLTVVALLALVLRWAYSGRRLGDQPRAGDQGLLVPVVTARNREQAAAMVSRLEAAGIRATTSDSPTPLVLVWPDDARPARDVLVRPDSPST